MNNNQKELSILLVDDDDPIRKTISNFLSSKGYFVVDFANPVDSLKVINNCSFDICILDIYMPELMGTELALKITEINPESKIILISGIDSEELIEETFPGNNEIVYLKKPVNLQNLTYNISKLFVEN